MSNACTYTSKKAEAIIEFGGNEIDGRITFFLRDNGAGFDMRYVDNLFKPFHRLHEEKEFHGTGVGLATVQRVVLRHHGKVWAEAELEKGATFYFTLEE